MFLNYLAWIETRDKRLNVRHMVVVLGFILAIAPQFLAVILMSVIALVVPPNIPEEVEPLTELMITLRMIRI